MPTMFLCSVAYHQTRTMSFRIRATTLHLLLSLAVAALAWWLVFRLWYPPPFAELAGGAALFLILVSVDVAIGPALTAVVANPKKPRAELLRDLCVVVVLQIAAMGYGLHTMAAARPAVIAFEVDLFRVVSAVDIDETTLPAARLGLRRLSWTGPVVLAAVIPSDPAEQFRTIELGLAGVPLGALPAHWREYAPLSAKAWAAGRPVAVMLTKRPDHTAEVQRIADRAGVSLGDLRTLPLMARRAEGVALIAAPDARVVGYLPTADGG